MIHPYEKLSLLFPGHYKVLRVFMDFAKENSTSRMGENGVLVRPNFAIWSKDTKETILHLILKRSKLKVSSFDLSQGRLIQDQFTKDTKETILHLILKRSKLKVSSLESTDLSQGRLIQD